MADPSPPDILIVGAGVLGLATAAELARRGHGVRVVDPGQGGASAIAAGMIAPALEAGVEDMTPDRAALLRAARDLWPDFAAAHGLTLLRRRTEWRGPVQPMRGRLERLGFAVRLDAAGRLVTDEDFQIEPEPALAALGRILGPRLTLGRVVGLTADGDGWIGAHQAAPGDPVIRERFRAVVLATGAAAPIPGLPPAQAARIRAIQPIRGQIGRISHPGLDAVRRGPDGYAVPIGDHVALGATMEFNRRDTSPDPAVSERLLAAGAALLDGGSPAAVDWRVGVRGATRDGLPLAGATGQPGLFMALAPRRNGWLLAPLAAAAVADAVEGRAPGPLAAVLRPDRLDEARAD